MTKQNILKIGMCLIMALYELPLMAQGVIVYKKDSGTGNWVKGAGFAVFKDRECTKRVLIDGNSGEEVPVFYYNEDLDMAVSEKFEKQQDTYYVKEVVVPEGVYLTGGIRLRSNSISNCCQFFFFTNYFTH